MILASHDASISCHLGISRVSAQTLLTASPRDGCLQQQQSPLMQMASSLWSIPLIPDGSLLDPLASQLLSHHQRTYCITFITQEYYQRILIQVRFCITWSLKRELQSLFRTAIWKIVLCYTFSVSVPACLIFEEKKKKENKNERVFQLVWYMKKKRKKIKIDR